MLKKVNNPILFQGSLNKKNYFEGWYYKHVTADQRTSLSFIPGVSLNEGEVHSFIQYILVETDDSGKKVTHTGYVRYALEDFNYQENPFTVQIGDSIFTEDSILINIADEKFNFHGEIQFGDLHPIQTSVFQPNIMGIFGYIPKMECYHGVISMRHHLDGRLKINGHTVDFSKGRGYIEKDWGTSFPKQYIWLHSNHFENPTASLFFSVAHIPFHVTEFEGFICNMVIGNKEYRFATYNRSRCMIEEVSPELVTIRLENKKALLDIQAQVLEQGQLIAPVKGTMEKTIKEGIGGIIRLRLIDKETGITFEDTGRNAGVEIVDYS